MALCVCKPFSFLFILETSLSFTDVFFIDEYRTRGVFNLAPARMAQHAVWRSTRLVLAAECPNIAFMDHVRL